MDAIISQIQDVFEGQIDFNGQRVTENLSTILLSLTSLIAFVVGFVQKDIFLVMWIGLAGTVLTMAVVVPAWPLYNQNPLPWVGTAGSRAHLPHGGYVVSGVKGT